MAMVNVTAPYTALESFAYDALIAPAVATLGASLRARLVAELPPSGRLLDVGCGGGHLAVAIASARDDARITGLDLSPDQIRRARRRARPFGERVAFVEGSALEQPFSDGSFDMVVSVGSIKHWPDRPRGLAECVRVLRPGGTLAVIEADRGCRDEDVRAFVRRWRVPSLMRFGAQLMYRSLVAGPAIDLDDARALLEPLPLSEREVRRIEGMPALLMRGRRS